MFCLIKSGRPTEKRRELQKTGALLEGALISVDGELTGFHLEQLVHANAISITNSSRLLSEDA